MGPGSLPRHLTERSLARLWYLAPPDRFGPAFPFVIVIPLTTTPRGLSLHVEVEPTDESGLDEVSYIPCEQLRSINRRQLVHRRGVINRDVSLRVSSMITTLLSY